MIDGRNRLMRLSRRRLQASMGRDSRRAANLRDLYSAVLRLRIEIINANLERLK